MIKQPLSAQTVCNSLKDIGLKAVAKKKRPFLTKKHRKETMDFALTHKDWTVEDWKTVVWSDETKINRLGSDGRKWVWKKAGEGLNDRLVGSSIPRSHRMNSRKALPTTSGKTLFC